MKKKEEVFINIDLPVSGNCEVLEGKGRHYFKAVSKSKGDSSLLIKYLIIELVRPKGKVLTEEMVDDMHIRDISYVSEVIGAMMSNDFLGGF